MPDREIRCAIVGYGPVFNWGRMHAHWMKGVHDFKLVAVCDKDPMCAERAKADLPEVDVYMNLGEMLHRDDVDMVSVVTPHNTHAPIALESLRAGKHTVVEKPMCITTVEATEMIRMARQVDRTLAVFHNRRHDGNVRAIKEVIDEGVLGQVFHIEVSACGYGPPFGLRGQGEPWRADKRVSGGALYDWGSHAIDWVLSLVPSRMTQVTGFFHKLVWHEASNEDQTRAIVRFEDGCVADIMQSRIAYIGKPLWYILGTEGAIVDTGQGAIKGYGSALIGPPGGSFTLRTAEGEKEVGYKESDWITYYVDLANHLKRGAPVPVSGEDGRRVITVLETAERSAKSGRSEGVPYP